MTVINLNKFKKSKVKATKEKTAVNNRVKFGRTKSQKDLEKLSKDLQTKKLDVCEIDSEND